MHRSNFIERLKSLSLADRWLLALCVLPLIFFVRMLYGAAAFQWIGVRGDASEWRLVVHILLPLILLILYGSAALVPIAAALKQQGRLSRILICLCVLGVLNHFVEAINYMRLVNWLPQEGFRWTSEIHVVLRLLPFEVQEGIWVGVLRCALWLAIAVLFIRKCQSLKAR